MDEGDVLRSGLEVPNTSNEIEKKIKMTCKSQHLLEQQVHSWYVHATERADRSDKRDERGVKLLYVQVIYCHLTPLLYFEKKVKIKLEELMEPVNREENCLLTV